MPFIDFPNVPQVPGVPQVARILGAPVLASVNAALTSIGLGQFALGFGAPQWGVFDAKNQPVAVAETVTSLEYRGDSRISNYPQEPNSFVSYNKVAMPYEARIRLVNGGDEQARTAFLTAIDTAQKSTLLYRIVTPEYTYPNANIVAYDYRRETQSGVTMLVVDLHIVEVRLIAKSAYSNNSKAITPNQTDSTNAQSPENQGQVQYEFTYGGGKSLDSGAASQSAASSGSGFDFTYGGAHQTDASVTAPSSPDFQFTYIGAKQVS
jgi:hypothetical protein